MQISAPVLSIIVCGKSNEKELDRTLDSLIKCTNMKIRIYFVLSNFKKVYLKNFSEKTRNLNSEIYLIKAKGIFNAMNYGLKVSETKYVVFINSGDELHSELNLCRLLSSIGGDAWGYGGIIKMAPDESTYYGFKPYRNVLHRLGLKYVPHPASIIDRKIAIDFGGFDENLKVAADQKLLMQYAKTYKPVVLRVPISNFYTDGTSSLRNTNQIIRDFRYISENLYGKFFKNTLIDDCIWNFTKLLRNLFY
jgi:glycosyltransferase involved in cell wall biosynthesis